MADNKKYKIKIKAEVKTKDDLLREFGEKFQTMVKSVVKCVEEIDKEGNEENPEAVSLQLHGGGQDPGAFWLEFRVPREIVSVIRTSVEEAPERGGKGGRRPEGRGGEGGARGGVEDVDQLIHGVANVSLGRIMPPFKAKCYREGACEICLNLNTKNQVTNQTTKQSFPVESDVDCDTERVVFLAECAMCLQFYLGSTGRPLRIYLGELSSRKKDLAFFQHFNERSHGTPVYSVLQIVTPDKNVITERKKWRRQYLNLVV